MEVLFRQRLEEVDLCLKNEDLNRSTIRILDLAYDFNLPQQIKQECLSLRETYNKGKSLGSAKTNIGGLQDLGYELLEKLKGFNVQFPEISRFTIEPYAEINSIRKKYKSRLHNFEFQAISLKLEAGKIIGLVGENGNGKTTVLRIVAGDLSISEGELTYFGQAGELIDWISVKRKIAYIPQRIPKWYGYLKDNLILYDCKFTTRLRSPSEIYLRKFQHSFPC